MAGRGSGHEKRRQFQLLQELHEGIVLQGRAARAPPPCHSLWPGEHGPTSLVVDRFHVAQQYRDDFDTLRKQEMKRLKQELPQETYEQDCKGTLWLLRKNHQDLEPDERIRLRRLFLRTPRLHQAYTLREELTAIFNQCQTIQTAEHRLTCWSRKVERLQATCFRPFIKTLTNHWSLILNYFADRVTSGFVEGLNNKVKTITRRCYGIRKATTLFQRLWLDLKGHYFRAPKQPSVLSTT